MSSSEKAPRVRIGFGGRDMTGESAKTVRATIWRLVGYGRPYSTRLILVAVLVAIGTAATLAGPILIGITIDQAVIEANVSLLVRLSIAMLGIYLLGAAAAVIYGILMVDVASFGYSTLNTFSFAVSTAL